MPLCASCVRDVVGLYGRHETDAMRMTTMRARNWSQSGHCRLDQRTHIDHVDRVKLAGNDDGSTQSAAQDCE